MTAAARCGMTALALAVVDLSRHKNRLASLRAVATAATWEP
jgi:hypothetical protein